MTDGSPAEAPDKRRAVVRGAGPGPLVDDGTVKRDLDALSLQQALLDVETANARVIDLTQRLIESSRQIQELHAELAEAREQVARLEEEQRRVTSTKAFRLAERIWAIRRALGG